MVIWNAFDHIFLLGCTPLHWAALRGNVEACTVLVHTSSKELLLLKDNSGFTPAQLASDKGHRHVAFFLVRTCWNKSLSSGSIIKCMLAYICLDIRTARPFAFFFLRICCYWHILVPVGNSCTRIIWRILLNLIIRLWYCVALSYDPFQHEEFLG